MAHDWVFAGSRLVDDPLERTKQYYLANEGDVICVANFEGAMLDLPIRSSKGEGRAGVRGVHRTHPADGDQGHSSWNRCPCPPSSACGGLGRDVQQAPPPADPVAFLFGVRGSIGFFSAA